MTKRSGKSSTAIGFAIAGSLLTIVFLALVNYLTSPGYPWSLYPAFILLWWPMSVIFHGKRLLEWFSLAGACVGMLFFAIINLTFSPTHLWFYHTIFALVWWPLAIFCAQRHAWRGFAGIGALWTIAYLAFSNILDCPQCPWALLTVLPLLIWPISMIAREKAKSFSYSIVMSIVVIIYYVIVNILVFRGFPWSICPAFAVLWWPLSLWFARYRRPLAFAVAGTVLLSVFVIALNLVTTPDHIWFIYPIFAVLWWPLSVYYFIHKKKMLLSKS